MKRFTDLRVMGWGLPGISGDTIGGVTLTQFLFVWNDPNVSFIAPYTLQKRTVN